jgi:hypothetical protein
MRKFVRHPAEIPVEYALEGRKGRRRERLRNVSFGGLCFRCARGLEPGTRIHIRIPACEPPLDADGVVAWSKARPGGYDTGVAFDSQAAERAVRMVKQVYHIEQYRLDSAQNEDGNLDGDQPTGDQLK